MSQTTIDLAASGRTDQAGEQVLSPPLRRRRFALHVSERKLLLATTDLLAINLALFFTLIVRYGTEPFATPVWRHAEWFLVLSAAWLAMAVLFNVYDLARAAQVAASVVRAGAAAAMTALLYLFVPYVTPTLPDRRLEILLFPLLAMLLVGVWRVLYATVFVQPVFQRRAIVVGAGTVGQALLRMLDELAGRNGSSQKVTGYHVLGFVDERATAVPEHANGHILGTHRELPQLVRRLHPDELVIAVNDLHTLDDATFQAILDCREMGVPVTTMPVVYERMTGKVALAHAGRDLHVLLPSRNQATDRLYLLAWRVVEIGLALVGCCLTVLLMPLIWALNYFTSRGPLFYRQARAGLRGHPFTLVKFRSMCVDAEKTSGAVWAGSSDDRVTPLGRVLRCTRLDELPQCWNVLKGEMSLIGPRPERPEFVQELAAQIPAYRLRHAVKPGLTGWAQVNYRYGASVEDALVKLQYDLFHIKHRELSLDLLIVLKTLRVILTAGGR